MIPMIQVLQSCPRMLWCKGFEINQFWSETLEKLMHVPKTRWYQCWKWGKGWKSEIVVDQICQGLCSGWWLLWCYSSLQAITLSSHWKMKVEYLTNNEELLKHREKTKFWHKWWSKMHATSNYSLDCSNPVRVWRCFLSRWPIPPGLMCTTCRATNLRT